MLSEVTRFAQIVRRRLIVILMICVCGAAVAPLLPHLIQPLFHATARLLVVNEATKDTSATSVDLPSIAQSSEVLTRVKNRVLVDKELVAFRKDVSAKVLPRSSIMEVTYRDRDSERAATIANAVADETVVYYREISTRRYDDVIKQLSGTIAQLRSQINGIDKRLQFVSIDNPYANLSDKASDDLTTQLGTLRTLRDQAYADLLADRAADSALASQGPKIAGIVQREALNSDPTYTALEAKLAADEATLAAQSASYTSSNPTLIATKEKVEFERGQLRAAEAAALQRHTGSSQSYASNALEQRKAAGKAAGDEARVQALNAEIADAERQLRETVGPGATVGILRAERDAAQQQYLALTQRLSAAQADATQAASLGTLVVVDRAIPDTSVAQLFFAYFPLVYSLLVCGLAIGVAYVLEGIDRRFREPKDLEDLYGRPVFEIGKP